MKIQFSYMLIFLLISCGQQEKEGEVAVIRKHYENGNIKSQQRGCQRCKYLLKE